MIDRNLWNRFQTVLIEPLFSFLVEVLVMVYNVLVKSN